MRHISRGNQPTELQRYRTSDDPNLSWDAFRHKDVVLAALRAQRSLCCYCTGRTSSDEAHVEHYRSRARHPQLALRWDNLLAVCPGAGGVHCDAAKADQDLEILDPADHPERHLRFLVDGSVVGTSESAVRDLTLLGLQHPTLNARRRAAIDAWVQTLRSRGEFSRTMLEAQLDRLTAEPTPHVQAVEAWLRRRLQRA